MHYTEALKRWGRRKLLDDQARSTSPVDQEIAWEDVTVVNVVERTGWSFAPRAEVVISTPNAWCSLDFECFDLTEFLGEVIREAEDVAGGLA